MLDEQRYAGFNRLGFERPEDGVLRVVIDTASFPLCDETMHRELGEVWGAVGADPATRVVLVEGRGGDFCGPGTPQMVNSLTEHAVRLRVIDEARSIVRGVLGCPQPVVAALHGNAMGAGLAVGLLADVAVAGRGALLIDAHVQIGVAPGDHAVLAWPLLCGMAKAKYHLLTGDPVTGEEAERIGLVARCVDDVEVRSAALSLATRLAGGSTAALAHTKVALNGWYDRAGPNFETSLALEFLGFAGPDFAEALAAFSEQRPPRFHPGSRGGA